MSAREWVKDYTQSHAHPQMQVAGFWGMTVFRELVRVSGEFGMDGFVPDQFLTAAYLARRLMWDGPPKHVTDGVTAAVTAGLLTREGPGVRIDGWERKQPTLARSNAERQAKWRELHKPRNEITLRNVRREEKRLEETEETTCGLTPAAGADEQRSFPLLTALPSPLAAPRKRRQPTGDPNHRPLLEALLAAFQEAKGRGYGMDGGADAKAVTRLLGISRDQEEHVRRWRNALALDRYPGCASIKLFAQRWNELGDVQTDEERAIRLGELRALTERVTQRERIRHY